MSVPLVLEGERVRLRAAIAADAEAIHAWYAEPERVSPFDRYSTDTVEEVAAAIERAVDDPTSLAPRFVVERRSDGRPVGCVGHYRPHPVLEMVEVWYLVPDPAARGHGFGKEAVGLLVDHLFHVATVERVGATCDVENVPSYRLLEALGFRREGTMHRALYHHGRWHDVAVYGVTRSEWSARPRSA